MLYRRANGEPVALHSTCPHRGLRSPWVKWRVGGRAVPGQKYHGSLGNNYSVPLMFKAIIGSSLRDCGSHDHNVVQYRFTNLVKRYGACSIPIPHRLRQRLLCRAWEDRALACGR